MNKTIIATLIASTFSFNTFAEKVDVVAANQATQKLITEQMEAIDASVLANLNAQNEQVVELNGVTYEQDQNGVWSAIGAGALGLTAALLSGSTGSYNSSSSFPTDAPVDRPSLDGKPSAETGSGNIKWSVTEGENGLKSLTKDGEVVAYVANDGTRLRNANNEPLGLITSSVNGNGATTYSVTLNNNSQFEGATITYREGNAGNKNMTFTSADGQTTYHWRDDRGFTKVDIDNNWGIELPDTDVDKDIELDRLTVIKDGSGVVVDGERYYATQEGLQTADGKTLATFDTLNKEIINTNGEVIGTWTKVGIGYHVELANGMKVLTDGAGKSIILDTNADKIRDNLRVDTIKEDGITATAVTKVSDDYTHSAVDAYIRDDNGEFQRKSGVVIVNRNSGDIHAGKAGEGVNLVGNINDIKPTKLQSIKAKVKARFNK